MCYNIRYYAKERKNLRSFCFSEEYCVKEDNHNHKKQHNIVSFLPTGDFYYTKAQLCMDRGDFPKAAKYLQRAIELSPTDAMIYLQYAVVELELENTMHARELLLRADELEKRNPETVLFLAETSASLGMLEDAIYYAELYLELDDNEEYQGEAVEIIEFASAALEQLPQSLEDKNPALSHEQERARQLMEKGEQGRAIEIFENIIAENPDYWAAYNNLALAYFYTGENEQARALLHEVLIGSYGNLHALCNLAVIAYYEKEEDELKYLEQALLKLHPYQFEHRFKLGATLALLGHYEESYKWLRSIYNKGFKGDAGFYFWLSHSAFFTGSEDFSRQVWQQLLEMDPAKEGFEPWAHAILTEEEHEILNDVEYITGKLEHEYRSERLFGLFLLNKTPFKHELIANPTIIDLERYSSMEKLFLAFALGHPLDEDPALTSVMRSMEVAEILYEDLQPLKIEDTFQFQMWYMICETALERGYAFKNPTAIAAAVEYMYKSSRMKLTKKQVAEHHGITTPTLTKYIEELMKFLPIFDS